MTRRRTLLVNSNYFAILCTLLWCYSYRYAIFNLVVFYCVYLATLIIPAFILILISNYHNQQGCCKEDTAVRCCPRTAPIFPSRPGRCSAPRPGRRREKREQREWRWADGWCTRLCGPAAPTTAAAACTACTRNCPDHCRKKCKF